MGCEGRESHAAAMSSRRLGRKHSASGMLRLWKAREAVGRPVVWPRSMWGIWGREGVGASYVSCTLIHSRPQLDDAFTTTTRAIMALTPSRGLGISFFKGGFQYSVVEREEEAASLVIRERRLNPEDDDLIASAVWFRNAFNQIATTHKVNAIGFKLHYDVKNKNQAFTHIMPIGVLALTAERLNIGATEFTVQKMRGHNLLGLGKGNSCISWAEQFEDGKPYWNNDALYSIVSATAVL